MIKRAFVIVLMLILGSGLASAQQDPLYTQYRNNMLSVNPAYAGSRDALAVAMLLRKQWMGMDGAPSTQTITVHGPLNGPDLGFGASIVHDVIGPTRQTGVYGDLSSRIKIGKTAYLAGGLKLGLSFFKSNLTTIETGNPTEDDISFSQNVSDIMPNVGVGVYYYTPRFYVGLSSPKIIQNTLFRDELSNGQVAEITEKRHYFGIIGMLFELNPNLKFKPTAMVRLVEGAPNSFDLTGSLIFADKVWIGAYHRYKESIGLLLDYNFTPQLKVGYSYDFTLTELQNYNNGSHELSITYDFIFNNAAKVRSPRYF